MRRPLPLLVLLALLATEVSAQTAGGQAAPVPAVPPPPPAMVPLDESLEPQVTIRQRDEDIVEETRINGKLFMIRVMPKNGAPYTLVDRTGDGNFVSDSPSGPSLSVPMWVIGTF